MPMKVVEIYKAESGIAGGAGGGGAEGVGEFGGVRRKVSFQLLEKVELGDYVLVHAGFAIAVVDEEDARETIDAMDEACIDG
jgi:hydrogenase expression/formation protein HypC